jgi:hypothetical protein
MMSLRSVKSVDYRQAVVAFYELNSLALFVDIYREQIIFFCKNYF